MTIKEFALSGVAALATAAVLSSCSSEPAMNQLESKIDYLPFQSEKNGNWGMISTDGKVLFEDEFKNKPTMAYNDRFVVETDNGGCELYAAEEKPRQIGDTFKAIGIFVDDVTPAVKDNEPVKLIDKEGKEIATLKTLEGKSVKKVSVFIEGLAVFETADHLFGAIDKTGKVIIKPDYCMLNICHDGRLVAKDKKYADSEEYDGKICILDKKGNRVSEISLDKFVNYNKIVIDGKLIVQVDADGSREGGIIDEKGEWIVKPTSKIKMVTAIKGDKFIFVNADGDYGMMNLEKEVIIRPKYDHLEFAACDRLFATRKNKEHYEQTVMLDLDGNEVGDETFTSTESYSDPSTVFVGKGLYAFVGTGKNEYSLLDRDGKIIQPKDVDIVNIGRLYGRIFVESDYVDFGAVVDGLKLTKDSMLGIAMDENAQQTVTAMSRVAAGDFSTDPSSYYYSIVASTTTKESNSCSYDLTVVFSGPLAIPNDTAVVAFSDSAKVVGMLARVNEFDKLRGKTKDLYKALEKKIRTLGKVERSNNGAIVVNLNDRIDILAWYGSMVCIAITTHEEALKFDIDEYLKRED